MQLTNYWALGFLVLIPYIFYTFRASRASQVEIPAWRRRFALVLRTLSILFLVLAISGLKIVHKSDRLTLMFALDVSQSVPESEIEAAAKKVDEIVKRLKSDDEVGLITFAGQANVQIPPQSAMFYQPFLKNSRLLTTALDREQTNLGAAIRLASGAFPEDRIKRLIILSDGNENSGDAVKDAQLAASVNIEIDAIPLTPLKGDEALIDQIYAPNNVRLNEAFEIKVILKSTVNTEAKLQIYRNRNYLGQRELKLVAGKREVVVIPQLLEKEGVYQFQFILEADRDTILENNQGLALIFVRGKSQVLYVEGDVADSSPFQKALLSKNIVFSMISPKNFPDDLKELQKYEVLILSNVSADQLSQNQMKIIQTYVRDLGNGLIMIGGERGFGAGGYFNTPVEEALPVDMDPRKRKDAVALVLIMDKSGSMANLSGGYEKIELAKEAAISAVEFLKDQDKIGVIAFDSQAKEVIKLTQAKRKDKLISQVGAIRAGGGTKIEAALKKAYAWLKADKSKFKHVVLLSDGQTEENLVDIARRMASDNITLSTISIGDDSAHEFMKKIGEAGKGRWYATQDVSALPRIFVREAFLASSLFVEEKFTPKSIGSDLLMGISPNEMPPLLGYVATSEKSSAQVPIRSHQEEPILAMWRYGLGRALAFTSDAKAKWAVEWLKWDKFAKFWSQAVNWTLPSISNRNFDMLISTEGNKGRLIIDVLSVGAGFKPDPIIEFRATATAMDSLESQLIPISQTAMGRFEGIFDVSKRGNYIVRLDQLQNEVQVASQTAGLAMSYSTEFKDLTPNTALLNKIADITGGNFSPEPRTITRRSGKSTGKLEDLWQLLTLIALILFPLEVAIRRLSISKQQIDAIKNKVMGRPEVQMMPTRFETLKKKKAETLKAEVRLKAIESKRVREVSLDQVKIIEVAEGAVSRDLQRDYTGRLLQAKRRANK